MWTSSTRSIRWRGNHCQCWNSRKKTTNETVIEAADVSLQDDWRNKQKDLERSPTPSRPAKKKSHTTSGTKKNNKSRNVDPSPNPITGREPITKSFFSRLPAFFFSLLALSFFLFDRRISPSLSDQSDWTIKRRATETMEKAKKMNSNVESQKKKTKKKDKRMCRAVQSILSQKSIQNGVGTREGALPWRPDASRRASFLFFAALCVRVCVCVAMATGRVQTCLRFLCCPVCVCVAMATGRVQTCLLLVLCCRVCVCVDFQGYSFDSEAYWAIRIFSFLFFYISCLIHDFHSDGNQTFENNNNNKKNRPPIDSSHNRSFLLSHPLLSLSLSLFFFSSIGPSVWCVRP